MDKNGSVGSFEKISLSLIAGVVGSLIGNPSDLALVRF